MATKFELLRVKGTNYEIGLQVGEALREKIPRAIDQVFDYELTTFYKILTKGMDVPSTSEITRDEFLRKTRLFLPLYEGYCPGMVEELRGIAKGANIDFEEALLLQIRGEIIYAVIGGCTSFVISGAGTKAKAVLVGQNWDYKIDPELVHMLHVTPKDGPRRLMFTFVGLTSFMGLNSSGVSHFGNSLPWGWCKIGIAHYPVKWRIYQETSLPGVHALLDGTKFIQPGNTVLCDGEGRIADAELTPEGNVWLEDRDGFFVHTNHFLGEPFASRPDLSPLGADSLTRYSRIRSLVADSYGKLDQSLMAHILADHDNYPYSICRHSEAAGIPTTASMIAEPERGVMHVCAGNPCSGNFVSYEV